ncbi:MAG TPA: hypothetical protein VIW47_12445, partial [Nitrospiraceae bacterium]
RKTGESLTRNVGRLYWHSVFSFSVVNVWPWLHNIFHGALWAEAREGVSEEAESSARSIGASHAVRPKEVGYTVR